MRWRKQNLCIVLAIFSLLILQNESSAQVPKNFRTENLVAWCIVPFDALKRGPAERAKMVKELGLTRVAYDWRQEHVSQFEEEIQQYQKHGIEFFAFWSWHESLAPLIEKYDVHPQIWIMLPNPKAGTEQEKIKKVTKQIMPIAEKTKQLGCKLGIYNHGGWAGDPDTMVKVCWELREELGFDHVGIVYNFHHGHEHIENFEASFKKMQPYLLCLNLNGMADLATVQGSKNKILPIGDGQHEAAMIQAVIESGFDGPIGVLDHRNELDSRESLKRNIDGLKKLLSE